MICRSSSTQTVKRGLLIILGLIVLAVDVPVVHDHHDDESGLYNDECPLARLAVPRPTPSPGAPLDLACALPSAEDVAMSERAAPRLGPVESPRSRAPPSAP